MPRRNRQKVRHQDKVVFVLDANSQNRNTIKSEDTYNHERGMIDVILNSLL